MSLLRAGHDVTHVCPERDSEVVQHCKVRTIIYPPPDGLWGRVRQSVRLYHIARGVDADVYHCNEVDSWCIGVLLRILTGRVCIFDVHEHYPSTFAEKHFPRWLQPFIQLAVRLLFRILLPFTKRLVLAKKAVSDDFPVAAKRKVLVRNFATLQALQFATEANGLRTNGAGTIVHLGLFSKHRGWPQVLSAMTFMRNDDSRLKVIGEINDGSRPEFEAKVRELGLEKRVEVYDWLPFEEAFNHLIRSHVGLIAFQPGIRNHVYAMPHKLFDYMAAGMAVLCPAFAVEVSPIVKESRCGLLIDPSSPKDIAEKLDALLQDRGALLRMGQRGQNAVYSGCNWETEADKLIEMYREIEADL